MNDFQLIPVCRPMSSNNRYYGGLALLIRKSIRNGIKIMKNTRSEFQWVKLLKNAFNLEKRFVYLFFLHITLYVSA